MISRTDRDVLLIDQTIMNIDGLDLSYYGLYPERVAIGGVKPVTSYTSVVGRSGVLDQTYADEKGRPTLGNRTVTYYLFTLGTAQEIENTKRMLGALNGKRVRIWWRPSGGYFDGRITVGAWKDTVGAWSQVTVTQSADPWMYDYKVDATVNKNKVSTKIEEFRIQGNYPIQPTFELVAKSEGSIKIQDVKSKKFLEVQNVSAGASVLVYTNVDEEKVLVKGVQAAVTLDSDYFFLEPGYNEVEFTNLYGKMTYEPRWAL